MKDPIEEEAIAHQAVVTHSAFERATQLAEARIVDELVALFRNNNLQNERAWALIGTISELRSMVTNARSDANAATGYARARRTPINAPN